MPEEEYVIVPDCQVTVFKYTSESGFISAGDDTSGPDGTYEIGGLKTGVPYVVRFKPTDESGYITEYWGADGTYDQLEGTPSITLGEGTENWVISPILTAGLSLTGTVTGEV